MSDKDHVIEVEGMFTIEDIKEAFWATYHESGEHWFSNVGTPKENEHYTQVGWEDFLKNLQNIKR